MPFVTVHDYAGEEIIGWRPYEEGERQPTEEEDHRAYWEEEFGPQTAGGSFVRMCGRKTGCQQKGPLVAVNPSGELRCPYGHACGAPEDLIIEGY